MNAIERVLAEARSHIGYAEESGNRTKFARALDGEERPPIPRQGSAWCGTFTDYVFKRARAWAALHDVSFFSTQAGLNKARRTPGLRVLGINEVPQPGDLAVKSYGPSTGHIGIVVSGPDVTERMVTIEGNTAVGNDRSGGRVMERDRPVHFWTAWVRPDWALLEEQQEAAAEWVPAIDVAKYQGEIDWPAVKAAGVELAIVKLHNSREVDPFARRNVERAANAGIKVAGYWYARSWLDRDPVQQALNDLAWADSFSPLEFLMADIEAGENCPLGSECRDWWTKYIAALPTDVWLYGGAGYLGQLNQALVRSHPIITARYPRQGPNPSPDLWDEHALALPRPTWPADGLWDGWQFTSSGAVPGVPARCDLNIIRRSSLGWTAPEGDPMSRTLKIVQEAGKPALYLASTDGIAYRWITDQDDLAFVRFLIVSQGGNADTQVVPVGQLKLLGVLVGPEPVQ